MLDSTDHRAAGSAPVAIEVLLRFDIAANEGEAFRSRLVGVLELLGTHQGYLGGWLGQSVDEATEVVLASRWARLGDWRRALSSPQVKLHASEVLYRCRMESTVFEVVQQLDEGSQENRVRLGSSSRAADADSAGPGSAAAPRVPSTWQA